MAKPVPKIEDLINEAREFFNAQYGCYPNHCAIAPGRVNLIGEHTDYNDGFVLPMALPLVTVTVGNKTDTGICTICTKNDSVGEINKVTDIKVSTVEKGPPQ